MSEDLIVANYSKIREVKITSVTDTADDPRVKDYKTYKLQVTPALEYITRDDKSTPKSTEYLIVKPVVFILADYEDKDSNNFSKYIAYACVPATICEHGLITEDNRFGLESLPYGIPSGGDISPDSAQLVINNIKSGKFFEKFYSATIDPNNSNAVFFRSRTVIEKLCELAINLHTKAIKLANSGLELSYNLIAETDHEKKALGALGLLKLKQEVEFIKSQADAIEMAKEFVKYAVGYKQDINPLTNILWALGLSTSDSKNN